MQLGRKCHVVLSPQRELTWTLILVSSLLLARGIASLGALTALAASMQHGRKPFLYTVCSQTIPPLDRFSSFLSSARLDRNSSDTFLAFIFLHSSRVYMSNTSCDRILTNEGYIDFDVDSCGTLSCDLCAQEHPSLVRLHICPWRSLLPCSRCGFNV